MDVLELVFAHARRIDNRGYFLVAVRRIFLTPRYDSWGERYREQIASQNPGPNNGQVSNLDPCNNNVSNCVVYPTDREKI